MAPLRTICSRFAEENGAPREGVHLLHNYRANLNGKEEFSVSAVVFDKDHPEPVPHDRAPGAVTVLSVSSGFASADQLARAAITSADAGGLIQAILLANPAPDDRTVGHTPRQKTRTGSPTERSSTAPALVGSAQ